MFTLFYHIRKVVKTLTMTQQVTVHCNLKYSISHLLTLTLHQILCMQQIQEITAEKYWRYEFPSLSSSKNLVAFLVLSIEPLLRQNRASAKQRGVNRKLKLAECVVVRERDFGVTDVQFTCVTHLGGVLREGDTVMG